MFSILESALRELVEEAPLGIFLADNNGIIMMANSAMVTIFGYSRFELVGKKMEMLMPEAQRGEHVQHRAQFFQSPTKRQMGVGLHIQGQRKDGSLVDLEIKICTIETSEGVLSGAFIMDKTAAQRLGEK